MGKKAGRGGEDRTTDVETRKSLILLKRRTVTDWTLAQQEIGRLKEGRGLTRCSPEAQRDVRGLESADRRE